MWPSALAFHPAQKIPMKRWSVFLDGLRDWRTSDNQWRLCQARMLSSSWSFCTILLWNAVRGLHCVRETRLVCLLLVVSSVSLISLCSWHRPYHKSFRIMCILMQYRDSILLLYDSWNPHSSIGMRADNSGWSACFCEWSSMAWAPVSAW